MQKITPFLWYDNQAEEAMNFYMSIFPNSKTLTVSRQNGQVFVANFELNGQEFCALNGGPMFKFTEAVSLMISCEDQAEVDHYWYKLIEGGGEESQCGWLKDKFGLSWQVVPKALSRLMSDKDPKKANNVMQAMLKMKKLDVAQLEAARDAA